MTNLVIALIVALYASVSVADSPAPQAVELEVISSGVQIQRGGTNTWFDLRAGAVMPVGIGDHIRTDADGRAFLRFAEAGNTLILPSTRVQIVDFALDTAGRYQVALIADGATLHSITGEDIAAYSLSAGAWQIVQPADIFGVWLVDGERVTVITADGELTLNDETGESFTLETGAGYHQDAGREMDAITLPLTGDIRHEAALITQAIDCRATIQTDGGRNLTVRDAPIIQTGITGFIPDGEVIGLSGIAADGLRARTRFFSGLGWVEVLALDGICDDLPVYPLSFTETYLSIMNVTERELELTRHFYGDIRDDPIFYRFDMPAD